MQIQIQSQGGGNCKPLASRRRCGSRVLVPPSEPEAEAAIATGACVVNFCATWCEPCAHLNTVFSELAEEHAALQFVQVRWQPARTPHLKLLCVLRILHNPAGLSALAPR